MDKKGMTMALRVVVTIVVLLIVAVIIVTIVGSSATNLSSSSDDSIGTSTDSIKCQTELAAACVHIKSGEPCTPTTACPACTGTPKCP
ncbi:MAG: hypothetical protein U9Q92_01865 [archaeon]|nr:hypothetical protein [archaeon]